MDVVSDELDPVVGVVARRQKHFKRADKILQYLRMAPRGSCRPSREGVARDGVLVPEPGPARGDHAVNRQQGFDGLQLERLTLPSGQGQSHLKWPPSVSVGIGGRVSPQPRSIPKTKQSQWIAWFLFWGRTVVPTNQ